MNKLNVLSALRIKSAADIGELNFKKVKTVSILPKVQSFDASISKNILGNKKGKVKKSGSSNNVNDDEVGQKIQPTDVIIEE